MSGGCCCVIRDTSTELVFRQGVACGHVSKRVDEGADMIYPTGTITIEELQSVKLPVVDFAERYKVAEVDVFLGKCADTLRNGYGLSAEEVERHSFTSTYMGGYAIGDVDLLLDRIAWTLKNWPSGVYARTTAQPCTTDAGPVSGLSAIAIYRACAIPIPAGTAVFNASISSPAANGIERSSFQSQEKRREVCR